MILLAAAFTSCVRGGSDDQTGSTPTPSATEMATATTNERDSPAEPADSDGLAVVTSVTDGDTFDVVIDGRADTIRLIGVDTPERGECLADDAATRLTELLDTESITLAVDVSDRDDYDRLLRYVWAGEVFVNEELVEEGLAIARRYEPDTAEAERFESAQDRAQAAGLGLWSPEACGPAATNTDASAHRLRVDWIEADAPGDDSLALNGEWVRIVNGASASISLEGWSLRDESSSHRYAFPPVVVEPGESVTVYSGCGVDTADALHWCSTRSAIWNNGGDTAFLIDPAGNTASSLSY